MFHEQAFAIAAVLAILAGIGGMTVFFAARFASFNQQAAQTQDWRQHIPAVMVGLAIIGGTAAVAVSTLIHVGVL